MTATDALHAPGFWLPGVDVLPAYEAGTPEWHESRRSGLGGSEIAGVLGVSPWVSRFSLWHHKAGSVPQADLDNEQMEWGRLLEPVIRAKFAARRPGIRMVDNPGPYRNRERPWQLASPDGLFVDDGGGSVPELFEAKTSWDGAGFGDPGTDQVPVYYLTQCRWYLDALDLQVAHLAVLIGGSTYREYVIRRHDGDAALMRDAAALFLADIAAGNVPALDSSAATFAIVRQLHPEIDGNDYELDRDLAARYVEAVRAAEDADMDLQGAAIAVLAAMGPARRAVYLGATIASRQAKGGNSPTLVKSRKLPTLPLRTRSTE